MAEDLSKRGKVGDVYRSGSYKKAAKKGYKTTGLSRKQMGKATTLKGKALTKRQKTRASELKSISDTKWVKGKGVVGKNGKAFTGTVQLASGKTASYVNGRRVGVNTKKTKTPAAKGKGGNGKTTSPYNSAGPKKGGGQGPGKPKAKTMWYGANKRITKGEPPNRVQGMSRPRPGNSSTPKNGQQRSRKLSNGNVAIEKYNASTGKWVTQRIVRG